MARPVKKTPEEWRREILHAAQSLFISKGYEETSISDIMDMAGGAKGMFYRCFGSKEDVMHTLGNQMFFENNPFDAVKERDDLNGLQKIRSLLVLNQSDDERNHLNMQAVPILKDPHILAAAVGENRRVLTPLWLELLEEGKNDGSIKTEYTRELSELLPLINFWLMPTVFPATEEELHHKYRFVMEMLDHMGLPIFDDEAVSFTEKFIHDISETPCGYTSTPEKTDSHKEKGGNEP
ncbi:MAG: TetR/AcrR family transcriptional regulator [Bacteroides sp.]|nr:TetR/AcrR family transcriptional regulator [Bacteroides sp.]MCM1548744.1 TetR/AcrR family transcriptional regulator [Clostridium sp.]